MSQVEPKASDKSLKQGNKDVASELQEEDMDSSEKTNKSQTVASIDVNIQWPDFSQMNWKEEAIYDHLHCCLCGSELKFHHKTNFVQNFVTEEASCPSCKIKTRESAHYIQ